jgi:hypothetical protein
MHPADDIGSPEFQSMALSLDIVLTVVGLAFSVAGYIQGQRSARWSGWYKSTWLPVILSLTLLVAIHWLHSRAVGQAFDDIIGLLERKPGLSIHQIYGEVFPRQPQDVIAEALENLHEDGRLHVETLKLNLPGWGRITVEVYAVAR